MKLLGNITWIILVGFISWISWILIGILWSITIIGVSVGTQCIKFAKMSAAPSGKEIKFSNCGTSLLVNIVWLFLGRFVMVIEEVTLGFLFCLTVVGIPFGLQHFKHAKLALLPFGARIYKV